MDANRACQCHETIHNIVTVTSSFIIPQTRGLQTFLPKGHISYYTAVRGSEILHNVIVSEYVITFEKFFLFIIDKMSSRP